MRILVDLCHPGHVHFFRHAIAQWRRQGDEVEIVARDKDLTLPLLKRLGLEHRVLSRAGRGAAGLALELGVHQLRLLRLAARRRPDVILNVAGIAVAHAAALLRVPALVFTDTEHAVLSNRLTFPFATRIFTPDCYRGDLGPRQVRYPGYHELAYLHPQRFRASGASLAAAGITPGERFFVVRLVSWAAAHDRGRSGMSHDAVRELVSRISRHGRVFVSSEAGLPDDLAAHALPVPPESLHDLLAHCALYVGEGATMASEAAVLGCPAVYTNPLRLGYLDELEARYGLVRCLTDPTAIASAAEQLAADPESRERAQQARRRMLTDKIDVTGWLTTSVDPWREPRIGSAA